MLERAIALAAVVALLLGASLVLQDGPSDDRDAGGRSDGPPGREPAPEDEPREPGDDEKEEKDDADDGPLLDLPVL